LAYGDLSTPQVTIGVRALYKLDSGSLRALRKRA